ncbi:hypothetical protein VTJ83DRAFT_5587 [Remersonia thermophila]|uniref:BTB domain-containing protein n=1 Tax=Remersonia thermophila TaxID=72144 RepID=A0ABR4D816_9PEZI
MPGKESQTSEDCSDPAPPHEDLISIDPDGDLILRVGKGSAKQQFRVCSSTLRRAAPVWKAMLFGPWRESKPAAGPWIVDLPEDDPKALRVLLDILHSNFATVPETIDKISDLKKILDLTDKYDMLSRIRPWAKSWAAILQHKPSILDPKTCEHGPLYVMGPCIAPHIERAIAAWHLGYEDVFELEAWTFVLNTKVDARTKGERGKLVNSCGGQFISAIYGIGLDDFEDHIARLRLAVIQQILDFYHDQVHRRTITSACKVSADKDEKAFCDQVILGGILRNQCLHRFGAFPKSSKKANSYSANSLLNNLFWLLLSIRPLNKDHEICLPDKDYTDFSRKVWEGERWKNVLLPHHKDLLANKRKMTGLAT